MNVWVLAIYHKHGTDLEVFDNDEKARASLYDFVVDYWDERDGPMPEDPTDAISDYFATHVGEEGYEITECPVL